MINPKEGDSDLSLYSSEQLDTSSDFQLAMILQEEFNNETSIIIDKRISTCWRTNYDVMDDDDYFNKQEYSLKMPVNRTKRPSKDKTDDHTSNRVLNKNTKMILFKLEAGILGGMFNCFSSGKEASIFHAISPCGSNLAVKIYLSSSFNIYKGREIFLKFDPRLKCKINIKKTAKFINLWAFKEFINLKKIFESGICCPRPVHIKKHVLVMSLIGSDYSSAPTLQNITLTGRRLDSAFQETVNIMERLFKDCQLVHADLSAFNLLYYNGHVWVVDVAQAVLTSHPCALQFLLGDVKNIVSFFVSRGHDVVAGDVAEAEEWLFKKVTGLTLNGLGGSLEDKVCDLDACRAYNRKKVGTDEL